MKIQLSLLALAVVAIAGSASAKLVLVDFNNTASGDQTTNPANGQYYNNANLPAAQTANGAVTINGGASLALVDDANTASNWSLAIAKTGAGGIGSSGNAANYAGPFPAAVAGFAASALRDGLYANNSAVLTFTFSGLDAGKKYHLLSYGGRGNTGTSQPFTLTAGTSASPTTVTFNSLNNATVAPQWNEITPAAGGIIALQISAVGAGSPVLGLNFLRLEETQTAPVPVIVSFTTDRGYVNPGQSATLSWQVTGADSLVISPDLGMVTGTAVSVSPTQTTTYSLTATNAAGSSNTSVKVAAGPARPNILFFLVDDMGANDTSVPFLTNAAGNDVPTTGNAVYRTPNMATLASQGMKFTRTYSMPVCTPTRVSLMTGMNSARHHVTDWTEVNSSIDTSQNSDTTHRSPGAWRTQGLAVTPQLLPKLLGNAGYRSIAVGKAHFGNQAGVNIDPRDIGFDVKIAGKETGRPGSYLNANNFGSGTYQVPDLQAYWKSNYGQDIFLTEALTLEMNKEIEKSVNAGVPFFAYMAHYAVHDPYNSDSRFAANYPGLSGDDKAYATMIEGMDKSLGDIVAKLNALGVAKNILIVFLSDNGSTHPRSAGDDPRRGYKGQRYEGGTRVPMIVGWAAPDATNPFQVALQIPAASRVNDIVSITDIFPTLLATAGVQLPAVPLDGTDISPYLRATPGFHRPQELMIHFPHDHNGAEGDYYTVLHLGDYKLIYNYSLAEGAVHYELFNLSADPHEDNNIAPAQPARVMAMARKMAHELHDQTAQWSRFSSNLADDPILMPLLPGVDLDGDGIDDNAEDPNRNGLVDPGETDPDNADTDSDGTRDGVEIRTGTDPLNPFSSFRATLSGDAATASLELSWPSKSGASYRIESSDSLANDWQTVAADVPAAAGTMTIYALPDPAGTPRMFYRAMLK